MGVLRREHGTPVFTAGYKRNAAGNLIQRIPAVSWTREAGGSHLGAHTPARNMQMRV